MLLVNEIMKPFGVRSGRKQHHYQSVSFRCFLHPLDYFSSIWRIAKYSLAVPALGQTILLFCKKSDTFMILIIRTWVKCEVKFFI